MSFEIFRVVIAVIIAVIYVYFDIFNNRDVPNAFVYAALAIAALLTFTYPARLVELSLLLAFAIGALGYIIYRAGFWGAGDFFELVTISLIIPMQPRPLLVSINQFNMPFVVSIFIAAGFAALWFVPLYYLFMNKKKVEKTKTQPIYKVLSIMLLVFYLVLLLFIYMFFGIDWQKTLIVLLIAIPSAFTLAYEEEVTEKMTKLVKPRDLQPEDIIAVNLMSKSDIEYFKSKYKSFGRLVTPEMLRHLKNVEKEVPVYSNAIPFALFIFIGLCISLLFGNILLFLI